MCDNWEGKMYLYHYYEKETGPFQNLSDISVTKAKEVLEHIKQIRPESQCAKRDEAYIEHRRNCEAMIRLEFEKKGGKIDRFVPHYMVVGHSPWLSTWYPHCEVIKIPIQEFDVRTISFTYGDSMPTFSPKVNDGKEYRHTLYTYSEILEIIEKYGFPQKWNNDGKFGPERYIEAHIWSNETIEKYRI